MMEEPEECPLFVPRCYNKSELARMYFPGLRSASGVQKLNRWIRKCRQLHEELEQAGYAPASNARCFTPREVRLIVRYLGEPY